MNPVDIAAPRPDRWTDPRVHLLDDTWLLTIFAILLATTLPWLLSSFEIDLIAASLGLLALGAVHFGFSVLARPAGAGERRTLLSALHIVGVAIVGFIWLHAGGLQNPGFLTVFALPVVGAIFISRWQPYLIALLAILVTGAIALAQAPELRWYAPGLNTAGTWLAAVLNQQGAAASVPFPGFTAPSGYFIILLEVFAIVVFACAIAAEYLGTVIDRLTANLGAARDEAEHGQEFWMALIEELPLPALLVDIDTLQIVCASRQSAAFCGAEPVAGHIAGQGLFETIRFSYPDAVQGLIGDAGGVLPLCMVQVGGRLCATEVRVQHVVRKDRRFALLAIEDRTEQFTIKAALDATGQAALVIDSRGRILSFNKQGRALFANIEKDADAAVLLSVPGTAGPWWEPGFTGRRKMQIEIDSRIFEVTMSASPLPGEEERLCIVTFLPVSRAIAGDSTAITGTVRIADITNPKLTTPTLADPALADPTLAIPKLADTTLIERTMVSPP
jgi:PAS domain-containing protein